MNPRPDSQDDDEIPDASELLDFELIAKSQPEKGRGLWLWAVLILVLAGGGWAGWMYMQGQEVEEVVSADGVPVIQSPKFELKERPTDPGGMKVPDRDKLVYGRMTGEEDPAPEGVERLLPPPEAPLNPPQPLPGEAPVEPGEAIALPPAPEPKSPPAPAAETPPAPMSAPMSAPVAEAAPTPSAAVPAAETPKPLEAAPAPAPAATPPAPVVEGAAAPTPYAATGTAGKGFLIQFSAVRTEDDAKAEWARIAKKNADILGSVAPVIQRADLGAKGIFWRVRGGWFATRAEAKTVCDALTQRNVGCIVATP